MKRRTVIIAVLTGAVFLTLMLQSVGRKAGPVRPVGMAANKRIDQTNATVPSATNPTLPENILREVPDALQRLSTLEQLGGVPESAGEWDWWIAQKTTWWGKRQDPKGFWKDRPVWLDRSASLAAHRHGRLYPPMPFEDPRFAGRSDTDQAGTTGPDSPNIRFRLTDRERAFWDLFTKTHPKPPESIELRQRQLASSILNARRDLAAKNAPATITAEDVADVERAAQRPVSELRYPAEAFSEDALRWAYVFERREAYEQRYVKPNLASTSSCSDFLKTLCVNPKLVTEPLTDDQLKAANAWKVAYLQRLRREGTDESYTTAYLHAWNLTAAEVFGK